MTPPNFGTSQEDQMSDFGNVIAKMKSSVDAQGEMIRQSRNQQMANAESNAEGLDVEKSIEVATRQNTAQLIHLNANVQMLTTSVQAGLEALLTGMTAAMMGQGEAITQQTQIEEKSNRTLLGLLRDVLFEKRGDQLDQQESTIETRPRASVSKMYQTFDSKTLIGAIMKDAFREVKNMAFSFLRSVVVFGIIGGALAFMGSNFAKYMEQGDTFEKALGKSVADLVTGVVELGRYALGVLIKFMSDVIPVAVAELSKKLREWWDAGGIGDKDVVKYLDDEIDYLKRDRDERLKRAERLTQVITEKEKELDEARQNRNWVEVDRLKGEIGRIVASRDAEIAESTKQGWEAWRTTITLFSEKLGIRAFLRETDRLITEAYASIDAWIDEYIGGPVRGVLKSIGDMFRGWGESIARSVGNVWMNANDSFAKFNDEWIGALKGVWTAFDAWWETSKSQWRDIQSSIEKSLDETFKGIKSFGAWLTSIFSWEYWKERIGKNLGWADKIKPNLQQSEGIPELPAPVEAKPTTPMTQFPLPPEPGPPPIPPVRPQGWENLTPEEQQRATPAPGKPYKTLADVTIFAGRDRIQKVAEELRRRSELDAKRSGGTVVVNNVNNSRVNNSNQSNQTVVPVAPNHPNAYAASAY